MESLSAQEARQIALAAQGFASPRPAKPTPGDLKKVLSRLGAIQIDAVNVLVRSQYLPHFSRLGAYKLDLFDKLIYAQRAGFEGHGHAASFLPVDLHPHLRWRMAESAANKHWVAARAAVDKAMPGYIDAVRADVRERGPLAFGDLTDPARRDRSQLKTKYADSTVLWWRPSEGQSVLGMMFRQGEVAVAQRRAFEPLYDLTERVIPREILEAPTPSIEDAQRELIRRAARGLGAATLRDFKDYFRMSAASTKARVRELQEEGDLLPVQVEGWKDAAWLAPSARARAVNARALLSPFDSLIWERTRNERIFGFKHSFEIYVRPEKRQYGYYVLPFLLGEHIVARVDLKADRKGKALLVQGAFAEPGTKKPAIAPALAEELSLMARWLGLARIEVRHNGDLARDLRRAIG